MNGKNARHLSMQNIITEGIITSQEMLLKRLAGKGFSITQATLSRDLKALGIERRLNSKGQIIYTLPDTETKAMLTVNLGRDVLRGCVSLEFSANLGVMKTLPGHAPTVAFALDNMDMKEILGTIAGDDTILIIPRDGYTKQMLKQAVIKRIPELKEKIG